MHCKRFFATRIGWLSQENDSQPPESIRPTTELLVNVQPVLWPSPLICRWISNITFSLSLSLIISKMVATLINAPFQDEWNVVLLVEYKKKKKIIISFDPQQSVRISLYAALKRLQKLLRIVSFVGGEWVAASSY